MNEVDRLHVSLHLDHVSIQMQEYVGDILDERKDELKALVKETIDDFDVAGYFKQEAAKAIRIKISDLVKRAFAVEWEFEKELQASVRELLKQRLYREAQ